MYISSNLNFFILNLKLLKMASRQLEEDLSDFLARKYRVPKDISLVHLMEFLRTYPELLQYEVNTYSADK